MKKVSFLLVIAAVAASLSCGVQVPADVNDVNDVTPPGPELQEPVNLWPADADLGVVIPSGVDPRGSRPPPPPVRE